MLYDKKLSKKLQGQSGVEVESILSHISMMAEENGRLKKKIAGY